MYLISNSRKNREKECGKQRNEENEFLLSE